MGFLHIKCPKCGKARGLYMKTHPSNFRCKCGAVFPLPEQMTKVYVNCPCCEGAVRYLTNRTDESFTMTCFECEAPVNLEFNERKGRYESL